MTDTDINLSSTSAQGGPPPSAAQLSRPSSDQLALPLTANERAASRKQLDKLTVGNRFRMMYGMPILPEARSSGRSR